MALVADAARSLRAAPRLTALAATVTAGVRARSSSAAGYNGLHLRLEKDSGYVEAWGGEEVRSGFRARDMGRDSGMSRDCKASATQK